MGAVRAIRGWGRNGDYQPSTKDHQPTGRGGRVVYRGGLENRFPREWNGGSNPSLSASLRAQRSEDGPGTKVQTAPFGSGNPERFVSSLTTTCIWVALMVASFAILWWQGQLKRLAACVEETREELKKCTWPSWDELKG